MEEESFSQLANRLQEEGKKHLTANQFEEYLFHRETLDSKVISFVENHISTCIRCRTQILAVENNKAFYQSLPEID